MKIFKILISGRDNIIDEVGTLNELTEYFSYTLLRGKSWQHEKGNKKINLKPSTISQLITNLNNAERNASANGYTQISYKKGIITQQDIADYKND